MISPGWPRWRVTLIAGVITTTFACSPFVFTKMLDFVVVCGLILMPMGTIVVIEHWLFPRLGWSRFWAVRKGQLINWPAMVAWIGSVVVGLTAAYLGWIHLFFAFIPVWIVAAVLHLILAGLFGARETLPELPATRPVAEPDTPVASASTVAGGDTRQVLYYGSGLIAILSLSACLAVAIWLFATNRTDSPMSLFGKVALPATITYFVSAVFWLSENERRRPTPVATN